MNPVTYQTVEPCSDLRPFVRRFIVGHGKGLENAVMQPVPTGCNYLGWIHEGAFSVSTNQQAPRKFRGFTFGGQVEKHELEINVLGRAPHILVDFTATGLYRLTGVRGASIKGQLVEMEWLSPKRHARLTDYLNTSLVDMEGHVRALEQALLTLAEDALPEVDYLQYAAKQIGLTDGQVKISALGKEIGISQRQLSRKYRDLVGIPPKFHSRVLQAYMAFDYLVSGNSKSLAEVAQTCGYYDQAHFVRAMQDIFRFSPSMILPNSPVELTEFLQDSRHDELT